MEKITLKPTVKEILYKTDDVNTHFDVLSYSGNSSAEKALGSLVLVAHASFEEEDLGYVVSLISSLAKREFYSEQALKNRDSRQAFEQTLNKLNEVLEDFFKNKSLALSVGLAAVAGDQLLISKLGKFKIGLARNGEYVDVLNNVQLFQKSDEDEKQFSNVISGKLQPGDKVFAYYPARSITSREKSLQSVLVKEGQDQFVSRIAQLAENNESFNCCGAHIAIDQIKEIPLQSIPVTSYAPTATLTSTPTTPIEPEIVVPEEKPRVIAAEMSVSKKNNVFTKIQSAASSLPQMERFPAQKKFRVFIAIAAIIIVPLFIYAFIRSQGSSSVVKTAYQNAANNLKLAQAKIAENNPNEARALISSSLESTLAYDDAKIINLRKDLQGALDTLDKVSPLTPIQVASAPAEQNTALLDNGRLLSITDQAVTAWFNKSEKMNVFSPTTKQISTYTLKDPVSATDGTLYAGNLYTLSANHIYKYADALNGGTKRTNWGSDANSGTLIAIAVDGNLYALTKEGKINTYFKGEKKKEITSAIAIKDSMKLYAPSETMFLIADNSASRIYAINASNGSLNATYKLDKVGAIKDITLSEKGDVMILSMDHQIWKLPIATLQ